MQSQRAARAVWHAEAALSSGFNVGASMQGGVDASEAAVSVERDHDLPEVAGAVQVGISLRRLLERKHLINDRAELLLRHEPAEFHGHRAAADHDADH